MCWKFRSRKYRRAWSVVSSFDIQPDILENRITRTAAGGCPPQVIPATRSLIINNFTLVFLCHFHGEYTHSAKCYHPVPQGDQAQVATLADIDRSRPPAAPARIGCAVSCALAKSLGDECDTERN